MSFYEAMKIQSGESGGGFNASVNNVKNQNQQKGFYASIHSQNKNTTNLESSEDLLKLAQQQGLIKSAKDIAGEDKLSTLQRIGIINGALNPAEALARDYAGTESFLTAYPKTIVQGIAAGLTGNDYGDQTKRRYYGDLLKDLGMKENYYDRFGLGLIMDIYLDPATYLGGILMRGAVKGTGLIAKTGLKVVEKVSPEAAIALVKSGQGLKDAFGNLFVHGYGASKVTKTGESKALSEAYLEYQGKLVNVKKGLAVANLKRYGNDVLTDEQNLEVINYFLRGKEAEFNYFDTVTDEMIDSFNKKFPNAKFPLLKKEVTTTTEKSGVKTMRAELSKKLGREASDIEVRTAIREQTVSRLNNLSNSIPQKIGQLQEIRNKLAQPFIENDLIGLKQTISELRDGLSNLIPKITSKVEKGKPFMATGEQIDDVIMDALSVKKNEYTKTILDLKNRISKIESETINPAMKKVTQAIPSKSNKFTIEEIMQQAMRKLDPSLKIKDEIVKITQQITKITNDMFGKQHLLESVLSGKQIAKERIAKAFATGDFSSLPEDLTATLKPVITDSKVEKAVQDRLIRNTELAKEAGIEDPFVMYAPSIAKDITEKQRLLGFSNGTRELKIGSKDYIKEFRNLLKDDELVKDRTLFLRVEDEIATNKVTNEFLKLAIDDYGLPLNSFKSEREATVAGYKLLKDKGAFGKEIGYISDNDWKFLNSHMNNNYKAFDAIAKATGFDVATSLFKRFVTGVFASFYVRNFASGEMQNFELIGRVAQLPKVQANGLRLANKISKGAYSNITDPFDKLVNLGADVKGFGEATIELHGKTWKLDDIGKAIEDRFGGSSRYNVDYNSITSDADKLMDSKLWSKEYFKSWGKSFISLNRKKNPIEGLAGENALWFKAAQSIGAFIEMQQKSKLVLGALEKGLSMDESLRIAAKGGFDYRALTMFESKIMRRIMPFYSFNRKNIELQLHVLKENPQRINMILRSIDNVKNLWETDLTPEEKDNLPAYLKEYLSVPVGRTDQGVPIFVRSFGTPIEAFTQLVKFSAEGKSSIERTFLSIISNVNPIYKVPIEIGMGKDSFRQRDLKDVYTASEYQVLEGTVLGDFMRLRKVVKKDYLTGLPRTTYVADPTRLLVARSLFTSRGFTYFNNIFNGNAPGFFKLMDSISGLKVSEVDIERQKGYTERRKEEELGRLLRQNGIVSEFTKLFIPKNKTK